MDKRKITKFEDGVALFKGIDFECCIWVVEGSDSALLIDTGIGNGNLKNEVEEYLNGKPYKVVNTHGHGDHSGGNYEFESVYMHKNAEECAKESLGMTSMFVDPDGIAAIKEKMASAPTKINFISEGDVFDLGDRSFRVIEIPGHTPGDIALYDEKAGILFTGDIMLKAMDVLLVVPQTVSVACYKKSVDKILALPNIKGFYSGHDQRLMPYSFIRDCDECAGAILDGTSNGAEVESGLPDGEKYCMRATSGDCAIMYRSYKIR